MIFGLLESFNDNLLLLVLFVVGIASAVGGIPPMLERRRRRSIENALPGLLESLSDSVGAGRGIQEAMMEQSRTLTGPLGKLLKQTLEESHSSSFDAALASFSAKTRSSQVQRVMVLIAFIVGLFAPASKGFQIDSFNTTFSYFFGVASAIAVGVSGRMLGRFKDALWWMPGWIALSMTLYLGAVMIVGG